MEFDELGDEWREDDGPLFAWLPPEDRLWRHPSEMRDAPTAPHRVVDPESDAGGALATLTRPGVRVWTVALAAGLAGALFASGFFMATGISDRHTTVLERVASPTPTPTDLAATSPAQKAAAPATATPTTTVPATAAGVGDWPSIASALAASIVAVRVGTGDDLTTGSGVLYAAGRDDAYVLTARNLVVGRTAVQVSFDDGTSQSARVVGTDALTGIAVLATTGADRSFPKFGTVSDIEVAEPVLAVGTRLTNAGSVFAGAISAIDESVTTATEPNGQGGTRPTATMDEMLGLTGLTMPVTGDGGALVDPSGQIVGIDTDVTADPSLPGVAYAVPIDVAEHIASEILAGIRPTHPWLGVDDLTDLSVVPSSSVRGGAQVGVIEPGSPAARGGLRPDDVITSFDGRAVGSPGELVTMLARCEPGQTATLTFYRQGHRFTARLVVAEQPANP